MRKMRAKIGTSWRKFSFDAIDSFILFIYELPFFFAFRFLMILAILSYKD